MGGGREGNTPSRRTLLPKLWLSTKARGRPKGGVDGNAPGNNRGDKIFHSAFYLRVCTVGTGENIRRGARDYVAFYPNAAQTATATAGRGGGGLDAGARDDA